MFSNVSEANKIRIEDGIYMYLAIFAHPPTQKSRPAWPPRFTSDVNNQKTITNEVNSIVSSFAFDLNEEKPKKEANKMGERKNMPNGENNEP